MPAYPEKREKGNDIDELVDDIDEFDPELKPPAINTVSQAEGLAEQLKDFVQYYGHEELSLTLSKVNLTSSRLNKGKSIVSSIGSSSFRALALRRFEHWPLVFSLTKGQCSKR